MVSKTTLLGIFLVACVSMTTVGPVGAQFSDPNTVANLINQFSDVDLAKLLVNFLVSDPVVFQELKDIVVNAVPILGFDAPHGWLLKVLVPWALQHLPELLRNDEFLGIVRIALTELNRIDQDFSWFPPEVLANNDKALARDYMVKGLFGSMNYTGMLVQMLQYKSVQYFLPYNSTDRQLNKQCYKDTMAFVDRLFHGDDWAFDMFDAIGKPTTGIRRGVLYFMGTYDQCLKVHADIPVNASLGEFRVDQQMNFQGRYCRATFDPPTSLIESVAGDHINMTYGMPLTISLGMCLPDSCEEQDIEGLLNLGFLGSWFNMSVKEAVCLEEPDFKHDDESRIVIGILGGLVFLVIISSSLDAICFQNAQTGTRMTLYEMGKLNFHDNNAYEKMEFENGIQSKSGLSNGHIETSTDGVADTPEVDTSDIKPVVSNVDLQRSKVLREHKVALNMSVDSDVTGNVFDTETGDDEKLYCKILRSFSVFTNLPAVMSTEVKDDTMLSLHGIRVITMLWIILGNTYLYMAQSMAEVPVAVNLMDSFDLISRFTMQAVISSTYATDTFFLLSGCLVSYWYLERGNWLKFYLGRLWKLTPPYMLVMVTFVYLYKYLGEGPVWPDSIQVADSCRTDWWKHLIYINNLIGVDGVPPEQQCMAWSWYLAVTMQLYLISPILVTLTLYSTPMGLAVTGVAAAAGIIATGIKEADYGGEILTSRMDNGDYWNNVFIKPWCRLAPYCIGIILGYVLQKWQDKKLNKLIAAGCWLLALCVAVLLVYIPYTKHVPELEPWTRTQEAVYEALGRPVWAICVAWVMYACAMDLGGPVGRVLEWKGFVPLSRVSYLVYLIHPVLMVLVVYSRRSLARLDDFDMAYMYVGHVVVNYVAAVGACLVFDLPFRNIKRIVQGKSIDTPY